MTQYFENEPARADDPAQNAATVKERFGIPDPRAIMTQVMDIARRAVEEACDNREGK